MEWLARKPHSKNSSSDMIDSVEKETGKIDMLTNYILNHEANVCSPPSTRMICP